MFNTNTLMYSVDAGLHTNQAEFSSFSRILYWEGTEPCKQCLQMPVSYPIIRHPSPSKNQQFCYKQLILPNPKYRRLPFPSSHHFPTPMSTNFKAIQIKIVEDNLILPVIIPIPNFLYLPINSTHPSPACHPSYHSSFILPCSHQFYKCSTGGSFSTFLLKP